MENTFEIIIVNYNTPELMVKTINSIRKYVGDNLIRVVDGSDNPIYINNKKYLDLIEKDENIIHYKIGYNIHHGPGMDFGLNKAETKYALIIDSDLTFINDGYLEVVSSVIDNNEKFYGFGRIVNSNKQGFNVTHEDVKYLHPNLMFLTVEEYKKHKKFIKHGAPCIDTMNNLPKIPNYLIDITNKVKGIVNYGMRGTVKIFGYNL